MFMTILISKLFVDMTAFDKWWQLNCEALDYQLEDVYGSTNDWLSRESRK